MIPIDEQLRALREQILALKLTPCVECGHDFAGHSVFAGKCPFPRLWLRETGEKCKCKRFVDPSELRT